MAWNGHAHMQVGFASFTVEFVRGNTDTDRVQQGGVFFRRPVQVSSVTKNMCCVCLILQYCRGVTGETILVG